MARWLAIVLASGAVLRVAAMLDLSALPWLHAPLLDAAIYERGAARIAGGDWVLADQIEGMSPGYFYALALVYAVAGVGPWGVRSVQIAIGLVAVVLVFDASRRVVGARWALLPAAIASAYAPAIYFEQQTLGESLLFALHAGALDGILALGARGGARRAGALGAVIGLAALLRPTALVLLAPAALAAWRARDRGRVLGALALSTALVIAPIAARNVIGIGEPVLIASHGGVNLWVGNGPGATGAFRVPPETPGAQAPGTQFRVFREVASAEEGRALSIAETDRHWTRRTIAHVLAHPLEWGALMIRKLHLFWNARELSDVYRYEMLYEWSDVLRWLPRFGWIAPLALLGLVLALARRSPRDPTGGLDRGSARWVAAVALLECAAVVLVMVTGRYRHVAAPALLVLAGLACREIALVVASRDRRRALVATALLAAGVAIAWPVPVRDTRADAWLELADAWGDGDPLGAAGALERAHALTGEPAVLERAAIARERGGDRVGAARAWLRLATQLDARGDASAAARARERAETPPSPARSR